MNRLKMFLQLTFLKMSMITDRDPFQLFLYLNWVQYAFQIDFFKKIIITTLECCDYDFSEKVSLTGPAERLKKLWRQL